MLVKKLKIFIFLFFIFNFFSQNFHSNVPVSHGFAIIPNLLNFSEIQNIVMVQKNSPMNKKLYFTKDISSKYIDSSGTLLHDPMLNQNIHSGNTHFYQSFQLKTGCYGNEDSCFSNLTLLYDLEHFYTIPY